MTLAEVRLLVAASVAGVKIATATDPFLRSLPRGVAAGAEQRTVAIFERALAHAEAVAQKGATDLDFWGMVSGMLVQHAGMAAAVIYDHGETIGELAHAVTAMHERLKAAEELLASTREALDQTLAELVMVRRDLLDKELDA